MSDDNTGTMVWGAEPSGDEKLFALAAHLSIFILPVIAPLVIYLIKKDQSAFVRYHALQSVIWHLIAYVIGGMICIGTPIGWVFAVMWALKANSGEWAGYPVIASLGSDE